MNRIVISLSIVAGLILSAACDPAATNTTANKPANATNNAAANTATSTANTDTEVKKVLSDLAAVLAKNDADGAAKFYSDDYHLITLEGVDQTKADRLADMRSGTTKFDSFSYENVRVRAYGETAVAIANVKATGTLHGKPRPSTDLIATLVLRKMADGWKVVSGQATPVLSSAAKPDAKAPAANTAASNSNAAKPPPANK